MSGATFARLGVSLAALAWVAWRLARLWPAAPAAPLPRRLFRVGNALLHGALAAQLILFAWFGAWTAPLGTKAGALAVVVLAGVGGLAVLGAARTARRALGEPARPPFGRFTP